MEKLFSFLSKLDYFVSAGVIGYGIYKLDWLYILVGLLSLGLARYNLSKRVRARLEKYLIKKRQVEDHSNLLKEHEKLYDDRPIEETPQVPASFQPKQIQYVSVQLAPSKHNKLLAPGALDLFASLKNTKV